MPVLPQARGHQGGAHADPNLEPQLPSCPGAAYGAFRAQREDWTQESQADKESRPTGLTAGRRRCGRSAVKDVGLSL